MLRKLLVFLFFLSLILSIAGGAAAYWGYLYITRDLPNFASVDDYRPPAVTKVFAEDGTLIAEFYKERRYPVKLSEIPLKLRQAFLAAEDVSFYTHPGIDPISIGRALVKNLQAGRSTQGGSTITQQVVKNLLLTPERNYKRKIKEAILSYRLEKRLSKDEILEIYLNQIFFGNTAYGIKAAAKLYFHKELKDITIAEAAILGGLPKAPSKYSPTDNLPRAKRRQRYVLGQMLKAGFITQAEHDQADKEKIESYRATQQNIYAAPYYVTEVRNLVTHLWKDIDIDSDGLEIHTPVDLEAERIAARAVRAGTRAVDKRRGWRGPIASIPGADEEVFKEKYMKSSTMERGNTYPAMVTNVSRGSGTVTVTLGDRTTTINVKDASWAKKFLDKQERVSWIKVEDTLRPGDVVEVALKDEAKEGDKHELQLDQSPELEGALTLIDPHSGRVAAVVGGYDYARSQFNRVTQSYRQPGSVFKPVIYLAAVDAFDYTPATIVSDRPRTFRAGDQFWTPRNFDEKYMGDITLQTALEQSRNLVSADIVSRIGLSSPIQYAKKLGIQSPLGRNISISLGTSEVTLLELVRAYGVLAAGGVLFDSTFIEKIIGRGGEVIYDLEAEKLSKAKQVINPNSAFILTHMLKGVVERGTATVLKQLGRPVAGKTGTTNDHMDAWFVGYTPQWAAGVWVGFDLKKEIGNKETGGKISAPIFLDFMKEFLAVEDNRRQKQSEEEAKAEAERLGIEYVAPQGMTASDFPVPPGVDPFWINRHSGMLTTPDAPGAIYEYFKKGSEPRRAPPANETTTDSYLESPDM